MSAAPTQMTPAQVASLKMQIESYWCKQSLYWFTRQAYTVAYSERFIDGWHIGVCCYAIQALWDGTLRTADDQPADTLVVNMPPGVGKSRLTCCLSPSWIWANRPESGLWFTSFGQGLCDRDALDTRQLITSDWYRARFWQDVHLMDDANQKRRYNTNKGGWRLSASIESRVGFGEHPSLLGIDDPHDPEQGLSSTLRQIAIDTWTNKFSTRGIVKGVKKLIVAQRLHEEDLSGYVLANEEGVAHLVLPMEFEPDRRCTLRMTYADIDDLDESGNPKIKQEWTDPRTEPGELLWVDGMDAGKVAKLKKRLRRAHAIAGQLQQRPSAPEGDMFRDDSLQFVDAAPPCYRAVRGWDKASSTGRRSDFTAGGLILDDGQCFYIAHIERGKWEMNARDKRIHEIAETDAQRYPDYTVVYEQEGASGGKDAAQLAAQQTHSLGFKVRIIKAGNVKKEVRWEVFADALANGLIKIVGQRSDPWVTKFIDELLAAPNGAHDDTIDAVVIPLRYMVENRGRGRIRRDLLGLTPEEQDQLREQDAAAGKTLCENCVGLGCHLCGHSGFVMARQGDDLRAIFDAACVGRGESELDVNW